MSDLETADERPLLRSIERRRLARGLLVGVPVLTGWWLLSRWVAQRWNLQPDLVRVAFLATFSLPGLLAPRWFGGEWGHDARETPRLRWLIRERADRSTARSRVLMVFALVMLLLVQCATLSGVVPADAAFSRSDGVAWIVITGSLCLRWRFRNLGDEGAQLRYLIAVNRAFLVTLLACFAAIVLDSCRGGMLRPALEAALLAGGLTLQLGLLAGERRAAPDGE